MAFLTQLTRQQIKQIEVEAYNALATLPADVSVGSVLGSIFDAISLATIPVQQQVAYVNSIARLATIGPNPNDPTLPNPDVDSFCNAFGLYRLEASPASGQVVFSTTSSPSQPIQIPAVAAGSSGGVIVQTSSGVQFQVIIDTNNANFNSALSCYLISPGSTSVSCTVQCTSNGVLGNVAANQISQVFSGPGVTTIAGIATVTNPSAFSNASALESDVAFKSRFAVRQSTGIGGSNNAIATAILGTQLALTYSVGDGLNSAGQPQPGLVTCVVNNAGSSTAPSSSLLSTVLAAVTIARAGGITCQVIGPQVIPVSITANIKVAAGYTAASVNAAATTAFANYANFIGLDPAGGPTMCSIARTYYTLMGVAGITDVTSLALNGGTVDVQAGFATQLVAGNIALAPY